MIRNARTAITEKLRIDGGCRSGDDMAKKHATTEAQRIRTHAAMISRGGFSLVAPSTLTLAHLTVMHARECTHVGSAGD